MFTNSQNKLFLGTVYNQTSFSSTSAYVTSNIFPVTISNTTPAVKINSAFFYNELELMVTSTPSTGNSNTWYVEFSNDGSVWGQEVATTVSAGTSTDTGKIHTITGTQTLRYLIPINDQFIRLSARPNVSTTSASVVIQATLGTSSSAAS